jgi:hypothetical protein
MKLTLLCLFLLAAPFALASEPLDRPLYGYWLVHEIRDSEDHRVMLETYALGFGPTGTPEIFVYHRCRIRNVMVTVHVNSPIKIHKHSFTIMYSKN